jgi:fibronectin type 3 domain-containing protein
LFSSSKILLLTLLSLSALASMHAQVATPGFVQVNGAVPQSSAVSTVSVTYTAAQSAGNLNVVVVGWNDTQAVVTSVRDTKGNVYARAIGPTLGSGLSQSIYYAKNIAAAAAGANQVTVTFSPAAAYPDIRILEYSGIDPTNPLDTAAGGVGNSASSSSGAAVTSNASDLLVGANMVATLTSGAGSGYTRRMITSPDGDIVQDRVVSTAGSYSATAPLSWSGPWVMQFVAFRARSAITSDTTPPTSPANLVAAAASASQINLSWTSSTDNVGVSGYRIERCQAAGCSNFAQIATPTGTSFSDTGLTASTSYSYRVRATDAAGNLGPYSNTATMTTQAASDATPPTSPANLVAAAAGASQINLSWAASTDNVGVSGYRIERCQGTACSTFAQVATTAGTSFSDTALTASTSYSYRVRATDAAGNLSGYSNISGAVTAAAPTPSSTPGFVQVNGAVPQSSAVSTVSVTYTAAQSAGNLNVVVVGWNDTQAVVTSVRDTKGNVYARAIGPTLGSGLSQSIYYAKNIAAAAAGANQVTVTFSPAAAYPDIRILEYSGIDPTNPLDTAAGGVGNSASSSSGAAVTSNASDLLVGANMVATLTSGAGSGYTRRMITSPDGDIVQDRVVSTAGSYSATAPLSWSGPWVMQFVAFRAASGSTPPTTAGAQLAANPISVNFGSVVVGNSGTQAITITNSGNASATISQANVTGAAYKITGLTLPLTLAAGASTSFTASFAPTSAGSSTGQISLVSNAINSPTTVTLSGTGTTQLAQLGANPASVNFGSITLGKSATQAVTITNTGNASVSVSQITTTGTGFSGSGITVPLTLAAGQSATYTAKFAPTTAGASTGQISFVSNAANSPTVVALTGTGTTAAGTLAVSPTALNFGSVLVGNSGSLSATLTASGASVTISSATFSGSSNYSLIGMTFPLTLSAGQSASFTVVYAPTTAGSTTGQVSFASNASNTPTVVSLSGTGGTLSHSVALNWTASTSTGIAGYNVYRATRSGGPYTLINSTLVSGTTFTDNSVQSGTTYFYVVTAVSNSVESINSNEVQAVVPSP